MRGKIAMPVIAALLLLMAVGGNAAAAPPEDLESYDAGADGVAFDLQVNAELLSLQLQLAAGLTAAGVTSNGPAAAGDAVGLLLAPPGGGDPIEQTGAHATSDGETSVEDCAAEIVLPPPVDLTDGTCIAGVSANALVTDGAPSADGASDSLTLSIGGAELTAQLLEALPLGDVLEQLEGILAQLNEVTCTLNDLVGGLLAQVGDLLGSLGLPLTQDTLDILCSLDELPTILEALLDSLGDALATTVTITLAPNTSLAEANDVDGVIAEAMANGLTIDVLPGLGPNGSSFIEVIVGASEASVVRDATTGEATPVANPALAEVNVNGIGLDGIDLGLGNLTGPIIDFVNGLIQQLAAASPLACGEPGPLADILCLDAAAGFILDAEEAAAEGYDFGEGTVGARTSALRLELLSLLNGSGEPVVSLSLAEAIAAANATPATPAAPTTPPTIEKTLPRTGSDDFGLLALAAGLGLTAVVLRLRRRSAIN